MSHHVSLTPRQSLTTAAGYIEALGNDLLAKGLGFELFPSARNALNFHEEWDKFRGNIHQLTGSYVTLSANEACEMLEVTMNAQYCHENEFNSALMNAMEKILADTLDYQSTRNKVGEDTVMQLKLKNAQGVESYIFGFGAEPIVPQATSTCDHLLETNHASCVLNSQKEPAVVAVVALKTEKTTCNLRVLSRGHVEMPRLNVASSGGPIAQVLTYYLRTVLPVMVENGIRPACIPWLVLACNKLFNMDKMPDQKTSQPCRFVFGHLTLPEICGDMPRYSIQEVGYFGDRSSVKLGMAAYLHVTNFGLEQTSIFRAGMERPNANILSGDRLYIGTTQVEDVTVVASPYHSHVMTGDNINVQINQGELVSGKVNLKLVQEFALVTQWKIAIDQSRRFLEENVSILCKVSCRLFRDTFIEPMYAFHAMDSIFQKLSSKDAPYVYDVLLAAYAPTPSSLITVMRDLSPEGYIAFKPKTVDKESNVWKLFTTLIENALLPLAKRCGVVFADLRIGWDETYNIMYSPRKHEIRLIDFESLTKWLNFQHHENAFHVDYDVHAYGDSRIKFVWWQIVLVAYCWSKKMDYHDFSAEEAMGYLSMGFTVGNWSELDALDGSTLLQLQSIAKEEPENVSSEDVTNTLLWLGKLFDVELESDI